MVDRDVVVAKVAALREHTRRLRSGGGLDQDRFLADETVQDAALFNLVQALQAAVDLAGHVIADRGWEPPASLAQAFAILDARGVIGSDLARSLASLAGLRNLVVHRYGSVDMARVHGDLAADLDRLEQFGADILAAEVPTQNE